MLLSLVVLALEQENLRQNSASDLELSLLFHQQPFTNNVKHHEDRWTCGLFYGHKRS